MSSQRAVPGEVTLGAVGAQRRFLSSPGPRVACLEKGGPAPWALLSPLARQPSGTGADSNLTTRVLRKGRRETLPSGPGDKGRLVVCHRAAPGLGLRRAPGTLQCRWPHWLSAGPAWLLARSWA